MNRIAIISLIFAALTTPVAAEPKAVVELFTSQGCSSCPPADRLMNDWAASRDIIALTMPVDYWDYLGWKDTLASHDFTERQRAYAAVRGDRDVYTPQVIVSGVAALVGSKGRDVAAAVEQTSRRPDVLKVPVRISATGAGYRIDCGAARMSGEIFVVPFIRKAQVMIARGENRGAVITYSNVARDMRRLGRFEGSAMSLMVDKAAVSAPGADAFAILIQQVKDGRPANILGAALRTP